MEGDKIVTLHSTSLVEAEAIQRYLEDNKISAALRDKFNEGLHAGYPEGVAGIVEIQVLEHQYNKAMALLEMYQKS